MEKNICYNQNLYAIFIARIFRHLRGERKEVHWSNEKKCKYLKSTQGNRPNPVV